MTDEARKLIEESPEIDNDIFGFTDCTWGRYIYGNGTQAATCIGFFKDLDVQIDGVLQLPGYEMPDRKGFWGRMLSSVRVQYIDELDDKTRQNCSVLVAVPQNSISRSIRLLKSFGFNNIHICGWKRNQVVRDICLQVWDKSRKH